MKLTLTQDNLVSLAKVETAPCISIYMPLSKTTRERENDKVRFENLLKNAARQIIDGGESKSFARETVESGFKLAQDHFFWKTTAAALAFFITTPQILRYFELPTAVQESVYVGKEFDLARLKKNLENKRVFYLLAASKNNLTLYKNENDNFGKLSVAGLPKNMEELAPDKTFEKKLQSHGGAPAGRSELFHGQGQGKETEKILVLKYFQAADNALRTVLASENKPLVFAGSQNLFPLFRKANSYPYLLKSALKGNFDETSPSDLQKKAAALIKGLA